MLAIIWLHKGVILLRKNLGRDRKTRRKIKITYSPSIFQLLFLRLPLALHYLSPSIWTTCQSHICCDKVVQHLGCLFSVFLINHWLRILHELARIPAPPGNLLRTCKSKIPPTFVSSGLGTTFLCSLITLCWTCLFLFSPPASLPHH